MCAFIHLYWETGREGEREREGEWVGRVWKTDKRSACLDLLKPRHWTGPGLITVRSSLGQAINAGTQTHFSTAFDSHSRSARFKALA